jgi:hypothetical protein
LLRLIDWVLELPPALDEICRDEVHKIEDDEFDKITRVGIPPAHLPTSGRSRIAGYAAEVVEA